jgi:O-antigen/teichoic acid export membrane protein
LARRNLSTATLQRGVSLVSAFVRIPLLLHTFGPARYGVWLGIFAVAGFSTISDFGLQLAVTQRVAELRGCDRIDEVRRTVATAFWLSMGGFTVVSCLLIAWVALSSPFGGEALAAGIAKQDVRVLLLLVCLASFAVQPAKILVAAQYGFERMYLLNVCDVVGIVVSIGGLWVLSGIVGGSLLALGAWNALWDLALGLVVAGVLVHRHPTNLAIAPRDFCRAFVPSLARQAAAFFFGTVANSLRWSFDGLIILAVLGPTFVPRYEPSMRLFLAALMIVHLVFGTLWPSFAESAARRDWDWVDRTFGVATVSVLGLATVVFTVAQLFGRDLLLRWVGHAGFSSQVVLLILGLWFLVSAWVLIAAHMTISLGGAMTVMKWGLAEGLTNIVLTVVFAHTIGLAGVALASLIAAVTLGAVPITMRLRVLTDDRIDIPARQLGRLVGIGMGAVAIGAVVRRGVPATLALPVLLAAAATATVATAIAVWCIALSPSDRRILRDQLRSGLGRSQLPT